MSANVRALPTPSATATRLLTAMPAFAVLTATAWLIWPALTHAIDVWSTTEEFSFGFLVGPIVVGLIWWRRQALYQSIGRGAWGGLPIVVAAILLYLLAQRVGINALAGVAVSPLLWGIVVYLWGWGAGRVLLFPFAFLVFGLGLYRGLLDSVGFAMQGVTAVGAAGSARLLGVDVIRDGLVLRSEQFAFIVAEACSGMSSLVSLLALAALWTYVARGSVPARLAVILSVFPLVIVANTVRVTLVLLVAAHFGQDAAVGFFHGASSLVLFGISLGGLLLISRIVRCNLPRPATSS
jgi:exosortase